jgi:acylphosphatase
MDAMTMKTRKPKQEADVSTGAGTATITSTRSMNGGIDFTMAEKITNFAETVKINDPDRGLNFPVTLNAPEFSVHANGKGVRTKPLMDLLAFAVANEDETKLKANQAELKSRLLAALPVWERIDGTYAFKDFAMESPVGNWGAKQLDLASGIDGISQNGKINYEIKASGLTIPRQLLPAWTAPLMPTDIDLNFGGANIDLDTIARKTIEAFDLNKNPPLPDEFGKALVDDFKAKKPKVVFGHSTVKNGDIEVAMEGEVFFPDSKKPDGSVTVDVAGYDKIVDALKEAAKSDQQMAQAFPFALAVKGFGKTLPDGRLEWVIDTKADGSVKVNGAMLKGPDKVQDDSAGQDDNSGGDGADDSDGGDSGGAGAKLQP